MQSLYTASAEGGTAATLTVIFHDWGVVGGMNYVNQCLEEGDISKYITPDRVVLFDALGTPHPDRNDMKDNIISNIQQDGPRKTFFSLFYRVACATAFFFWSHISKQLGNFIQGMNRWCMEHSFLWPLYDVDVNILTSRQNPISTDRMAYMGYPYYNMLKMIFTGRAKGLLYCFSLPKDMNRTPVLYMYGMHKRVHFHIHAGLVALMEEQARERSKCRVVALEGAGHWLYLQKPEICMDEVVRFISDA